MKRETGRDRISTGRARGRCFPARGGQRTGSKQEGCLSDFCCTALTHPHPFHFLSHFSFLRSLSGPEALPRLATASELWPLPTQDELLARLACQQTDLHEAIVRWVPDGAVKADICLDWADEDFNDGHDKDATNSVPSKTYN